MYISINHSSIYNAYSQAYVMDIFFLLHENICSGYPYHMRNKKNSHFIPFYLELLGMKCSLCNMDEIEFDY